MFGYIRTDFNNMYVKDVRLYRAMYCGLCKGIGGTCGQCGRLALNYDLTFYSAFCHNVLGIDVDVRRKRCILHWLAGREIAARDSLTDRIACLNVILAYRKLTDDVIDNHRGRTRRAFFAPSYRRARQREPAFDEIVREQYAVLLDYENKGGESIDEAADAFAMMMKRLTKELLGEKYGEDSGDLAYNLGKWVYLIDALDDFDKDVKKKKYNPLAKAYPDCRTKQELLLKHGADVKFIFGTALSAIADDAKKIKYEFNHDLTDNILFRGLAVKTMQVMQGKKRRKDAGKLQYSRT